MDTPQYTPCDDDDQHIPHGLTAQAWMAIGSERRDGEWRVPERSAQGEIIGWSRRPDSGPKGFVAGGRRGLTMPWPLDRYAGTDADDPVCVVEGATDTAAGLMLGLDMVGRPSATGGADALRALLRGRHVAIIAENDDAGRAGASKIARALVEDAATVRIAYPPEGAKDLRQWVTAPVAPASRAEVLAAIAGGEVVEAGEEDDPDQSPVLLNMADVTPECIRWLWPGRIAQGKVAVLAGNGGLGKSTVVLDIVARLTTGCGWPDAPGETFEPGGAVLLSAEDDPADTIRPRLDAAGADARQINLLRAIRKRDPDTGLCREHHVDLAGDIEPIERAIRQTPGCRLVVVDPITAYMGKVDEHRNAEVRGLIAPLASLAAKHDVAVLAVTHLNKGQGEAIHRIVGSIAFGAAARTALAFTRDPDDPARRLMVGVKSNIGPESAGLAYRIEPSGGEIDVGVVAWESEPVDMSAEQAMSGGGQSEANSAADEALHWLTDLLSDGSRPAKEVKAMAEDDGIKPRTLDRAKAKAGVLACREGFDRGSRWVWKLAPPKCAKPASTPSGLAHYGELAHYGDSEPSAGDSEPRSAPDSRSAPVLGERHPTAGDVAHYGSPEREVFGQ